MSARILLAVLATPALSGAQQILEIDHSVGRTIIHDEWRAMRPSNLGTDWDRNLLYVHDREEPEGIMVFSLETGEWVRTIPTPRGDGPFELSQGKGSIALAGDGGLYVAGFLRVLTFDSNHDPVSSWTPGVPALMGHGVCDLGGKPAIPILNGVLRHEREAIGPNAVADRSPYYPGPITAGSEEEARARAQAMVTRAVLNNRARIVCTEDRAFVVRTYEEGPDSVFVHHLNGGTGRVAVPTEFTENWGCRIGGKPCPPWSHNVHPSLDDQGNLVLFSNDFRTGGAIIDPETGCYAIVQKDPATDMPRIPVRVKGDSVLVFQQDQGEPKDGAAFRLFMGSTNKASLHPLRRVSGEPCPGMAPGRGL